VRLVRGGPAVPVLKGPEIKTQTSIRRGPPSGGQGGPALSGAKGFMEREDRNSDGKVTRDEFRDPAEHFDRLDKNGDGVITEDEAPTGPPDRR